MRIALAQTSIHFEDFPKNLKRAEEMIREAASRQADLIAFPEMSFTGFSMHTGLTGELEEASRDFVRQMAITHGIAIVYGWTKKTPEMSLAENHASVISPEGKILADYQKIHPFHKEALCFDGGNQLVEFEYKGMTFSLFICYDLRFPEPVLAAAQRSHVILFIANWPEKRRHHWETLLRARAIENQVYVAGVNCTGVQKALTYSGDSAILSYDGTTLAYGGEEEKLVYGDLHLEEEVQYRQDFPVRMDRKIHLYRTFYPE